MAIHQKEIVLKGKPLDIPDQCVVDVTGMEIGDQVTVGEIAVPANVTKVTSGDTVVVFIQKEGLKVVEEEEDAAEEVVVEATDAA